MNIGIINVTGYAGAEIARILHRHSKVDIVSVTGRSDAGKRLGDIFPHLSDIDIVVSTELTPDVDLVFSALPHSASASAIEPLLARGVKVIDISADFRFKSLESYSEWYGDGHPCPQYIKDAIYGLPEIYRDRIATSNLVGNPGCYPTASVLALAPALRAGITESDIIVDAKSGVSGAGRGLSLKLHFCEANESVSAYGLEGHRHSPEIAQELTLLNSSEVKLTFIPHLIPMTRGILTSCYASIRRDVACFSGNKKINDVVQEIYRQFYRDETFIHVTEDPPGTKHTLGNNNCLVYPRVDERSNKLIVISCIDNLIKGAAGQAVQNMNIMCGFSEDEGLTQLAIYP